MLEEKQYCLSDFEIRKCGNHYASYFKGTNKIFMHGQTWHECYEDLLEEFGEER